MGKRKNTLFPITRKKTLSNIRMGKRKNKATDPFFLSQEKKAGFGSACHETSYSLVRQSTSGLLISGFAVILYAYM